MLIPAQGNKHGISGHVKSCKRAFQEVDYVAILLESVDFSRFGEDLYRQQSWAGRGR